MHFISFTGETKGETVSFVDKQGAVICHDQARIVELHVIVIVDWADGDGNMYSVEAGMERKANIRGHIRHRGAACQQRLFHHISVTIQLSEVQREKYISSALFIIFTHIYSDSTYETRQNLLLEVTKHSVYNKRQPEKGSRPHIRKPLLFS